MIQKFISNLFRYAGMLFVLLLIGYSSHSVASEKISNSGENGYTSQAELDSLNLDAKSLVFSVDTFPVYWPEFQFWLKYIQNYYQSNLSEVAENWDEQETGMDINEFYFSTATGYAAKDRAIELKSVELGLELTEKDKETIEELRNENIRIYGGLSEYLRIVQSMYVSESVYNYLTKIEYLGNYLFDELYGANGEKCTDNQVHAYVEENRLNSVKYVYLPNTDEKGNRLNSQDLENNYSLMEYDLIRLKQSDSPVLLFDVLTTEYSESTNTSNYPDGLLFAGGTMDEALENAFNELGNYEYSGIVETEDGYYILMRIPISYDMIVDSSGETLRHRVAYDYYFKNWIEDHASKMKITYEETYYKILESFTTQ